MDGFAKNLRPVLDVCQGARALAYQSMSHREEGAGADVEFRGLDLGVKRSGSACLADGVSKQTRPVSNVPHSQARMLAGTIALRAR
jgi:hypothetical protein